MGGMKSDKGHLTTSHPQWGFTLPGGQKVKMLDQTCGIFFLTKFVIFIILHKKGNNIHQKLKMQYKLSDA